MEPFVTCVSLQLQLNSSEIHFIFLVVFHVSGWAIQQKHWFARIRAFPFNSRNIILLLIKVMNRINFEFHIYNAHHLTRIMPDFVPTGVDHQKYSRNHTNGRNMFITWFRANGLGYLVLRQQLEHKLLWRKWDVNWE